MAVIPKCLATWVPRLENRRFLFTLTTLSLCAAKGGHLHASQYSVAPKRMILFFFSFFTQDVLFLIFLRLLVDHWVNPLRGKLRTFVSALTGFLIFYNVFISIVSLNFYMVAGSEVQWHNIGLAADPAAWGVFASGLPMLAGNIGLILFLSMLLQVPCYGLFGWGADIFNFFPALIVREVFQKDRLSDWILGRSKSGRSTIFDSEAGYDKVAARDSSIELAKDDEDRASFAGDSEIEKSTLLYSEPPLAWCSPRRCQLTRQTWRKVLRALPYVIVSILLLAQFILTGVRPKDPSLIFLSWSVGLLPFVDFASTSPYLDDLPFYYNTSIGHQWDNITALTEPLSYPWIKEDQLWAGFHDWSKNNTHTHYNATADPLKISNLETPLHEQLRGKLENIDIKHVILVVLESTRHDVFPIKKDGVIWKQFADSFPDGKLPQEAIERMATLTPTANYITGDYDDGFEHAETPKRGGVRFTKAHTAGTYTLKSLTGTICGVTPLVADFNVEWSHHIYQPCLPQIFEAMNKVEGIETEGPAKEGKWNSYFFQSATMDYDNQKRLMEHMGFSENNTVNMEYLRRDDAKHGRVDLPLINAFTFEEDPLEDYIRDIFVDANEKNERVFLGHLTSTSHHRFRLPKGETYVPLAKNLNMMSRYINTEGYDDRWLRKVLNVLDEQGVANETLMVFLGDHGVSLPENYIASPYLNPSVGADHVPLVISHPQLPAFDIHDAVHSTQVLPTILDILLETGSLTESSRQVAQDLVKNYEGQSLIRPLQTHNEKNGIGNWEFTVASPGRAMLTARDARFPERHLVIPVIENVVWRYGDLNLDPLEQDLSREFDFHGFLDNVEHKYGRDVAEWIEEGAFFARWVVQENTRRWFYEG